MQANPISADSVAQMLREHGITPTSQRLDIAQILFARHEHLSAEDVFNLVNGDSARVSKATVYNTLGLFAERYVQRERYKAVVYLEKRA